VNYTIRNREISYKILVSICHPWLSAIPVAYLLFTPAIRRDIRADLQLCRCELFWQSIRFYSHLLMCCRIFLQLLYKLLHGRWKLGRWSRWSSFWPTMLPNIFRLLEYFRVSSDTATPARSQRRWFIHSPAAF